MPTKTPARPRATLLITQSDVERLTAMPAAIQVVRRAFEAQGRGQITMPSKIYLSLPHENDFRAMPASISRPPACGLKWVSVHPANPRKGLPTVMGLVIVNDPATGEPLAILDGLSITRIRTGAAAAVAADALARQDSHVVALVGFGAQALSQLQGLASVREVHEVHVWDFKAGEAAAFIRRAQRVVRTTYVAAPTLQACVAPADIIVTLTPSREPIVARAWIRPGVHINAVGADAPGKQELDPQILREAVVVVDELEQATHGGEINVAVSRGLFRPDQAHGTLADVLLKRRPGRQYVDQITVFDSTGLAVHDIALADEIVRLAIRKGHRRQVAFFSPTPSTSAPPRAAARR